MVIISKNDIKQNYNRISFTFGNTKLLIISYVFLKSICRLKKMTLNKVCVKIRLNSSKPLDLDYSKVMSKVYPFE